MDEKNTVPLPRATTVAYGEHPSQFIDVYTPAGAGPHPVVVLIHGGFWRLPWGRDLMSGLASDLVGRGFAAVNVEYRRLGEDGGGWPGTCEDVVSALSVLAGKRGEVDAVGMGTADAVDAVNVANAVDTAGGVDAVDTVDGVDRGNEAKRMVAADSGAAAAADPGAAAGVDAGTGTGTGTGPEPDSDRDPDAETGPDLGLDLGRVGLVGHSAGGHLALWAAKHAPFPVRVVVSQSGVLDLRAAARDRLDGGADGRLPAAVDFVGGEAGDVRFDAAYSLASPIELLPLGADVHQFVLHGDADNRVPFQQSVDYVAAAEAAGDSVELAAFAGMGHFEVIDAAHESWLRAVGELARRLGA
jgi:acetyl esterase/lipase